MRKAALGLWIVGFLAWGPAVAWADGVSRDGMGAISIGRGGTDIANSDNGAVLLDNPAGIGNVDGNGLFEVGADILITDLSFNSPRNDSDAQHTPMPLPFLSFAQKSEDGRWAYGFGVFAPAGFGATWEINSPLFGPEQYRSLGALGKLLPAAAYHVTDQLTVGGTFGLAVSHVELAGPFVLQTGPLRGTPSLLSLTTTGYAPTYSLGLQYQLDDETMIGLSYTSESLLHLDGHATTLVPLGPTPVFSKFDAATRLVWPRSLGLGVSHSFGDTQRVSADVIWYDWSNAFDRVDLRLTNSSNPIIPALAGPTINDRFPLDWRDSVSVRLGYEYFLSPCQTLRAGYIYHPQPIPTETLTPYVPAILKHAFSIGYSREWQNWSVNVAYQYSFGPDKQVLQSGLVGGDFNNSQDSAQAHWLAVSFKYRF